MAATLESVHDEVDVTQMTQALLKIIQNKIRNLKKAVEKATAIEKLAEKGGSIQPDQRESLAAKPGKTMLLEELEEILRKQSAVVFSYKRQEEKSRKRMERRKKLNADSSTTEVAPDAEDARISVVTANEETKPLVSNADTGLEMETDQWNEHAEAPALEMERSKAPTAENEHSEVAFADETLRDQLPEMSGEREFMESSTTESVGCDDDSGFRISKNRAVEQAVADWTLDGYETKSSNVDKSNEMFIAMAKSNGAGTNALDLSNEAPSLPVTINEDRMADLVSRALEPRDYAADLVSAISRVLELLHVVDYIRSPGAKQTILDYFSSESSLFGERMISAYDLELILYFVVMLTTPDGEVAHHAAVETSTAHCLAYLQCSSAEAFTGTTYATLCDIVRAVGEHGPLASRGVPTAEVAAVEEMNAMISSGSKDRSVIEGRSIDAAGASLLSWQHGVATATTDRHPFGGGSRGGGRGNGRRGPRLGRGGGGARHLRGA